MSLNDLLHIDLENFHFLRPQWLWLMAPAVIILFLFIVSIREKKKWKELISAELRPFMFTKGSKLSILAPVAVYLVAVILGVLAMAGPTWKKIEVPGAKIQAIVLIGLDLSQSMMAGDIQPNRLERAKFKIVDFLNANPRARAGLVAIAGTTHPVLPVTSDYNLIKHHASSLQSWIMPVPGRNLSIAMNVVDSVMKKTEAPSTLLLMTDEIQADEIPLLTNFVNNTPHRIEILLMATPQGAVVPAHRKRTTLKHRGADVFSKPDPNVLAALKNEKKIALNYLTLDKSDVEQIATRIRDGLIYQKQTEQSNKDWQDMGLLFVMPMVLFALLWFRKGWVIQWCWIPAIFLFGSCSVDSKQADWWYTADYQGQILQTENRFEEASDRFTDVPHKAVASYKAGDYETAVELFALDSSAVGKYNRGLALVKLGRYQEAEESFNDALARDPAFAQAKNSLDKTKRIITQVDSVTRFGNEKQTPKTKEKDRLKERKPKSKDEQLSSDTEVKKLPKKGDRITDEVESNVHRARESDRPDTTAAPPSDDAQRILLQKVAADPSEFLRRRFQLQKEKYYRNVKEGEVTW